MRLLCFAAVVFLTGVLSAAQDPPRFRVDVPIVSLDVYVDDLTGKPITNLKREDFTAFEDGEPREITNFTSAETPYNLLLLFDRSSSTESHWSFLLQAISRLVSQLGEQDRIALAAFDDKPEMLVDWKSARGTRQSFRIPSGGGGTNLYRALEWSTRELRNVKGRKGVIVFTDGIDNRLAKDLVKFDARNEPRIATPAEDRDFGEVLQTVMKATVPFYFVAVDPTVTSGFELQMREQAHLRMELVAGRSNGHTYYPKTLQEVAGVYEQIGKELGNSYSIGFAPGSKPDGKHHRIEIRVRDRGMRVTQSREGYDAVQ